MDRDEQLLIAESELFAEHLRGARGLRARILEPARGEVLRDRDSEYRADHHQQARNGQDQARRANSQDGDTMQHNRYPPPRPANL